MAVMKALAVINKVSFQAKRPILACLSIAQVSVGTAAQQAQMLQHPLKAMEQLVRVQVT